MFGNVPNLRKTETQLYSQLKHQKT